MSTLCLLFEWEIISCHLLFESIVLLDWICVVTGSFMTSESSASFSRLFRFIRAKVERSLLQDGSLNVDSFAIVAIDHTVAGTWVNLFSVSSLCGPHGSISIAQAKLSRLHLWLKLGSVGDSSSRSSFNCVMQVRAIGVRLVVRLMITHSEVRSSQLNSLFFQFRIIISCSCRDSASSLLSLIVNVRKLGRLDVGLVAASVTWSKAWRPLLTGSNTVMVDLNVSLTSCNFHLLTHVVVRSCRSSSRFCIVRWSHVCFDCLFSSVCTEYELGLSCECSICSTLFTSFRSLC